MGYEIINYQQSEKRNAGGPNRAMDEICSDSACVLLSIGKHARRDMDANAGNFGLENDAL
jgi:hypothetical protein